MDKKSIFLALFIFIIIVLAFYFSYQEIPVIPENQNLEEDRPEEELEEVNFFVYNDEEAKELKLSSKQVSNFKSEQRMELNPIEVEVFSSESGELLYTLDGDSGIYYTDSQSLELSGDVVIDSDLYHISMEQLEYDLQRNYLEGRGSVKITGKEFSSSASSFNSDLNLKDLKLSQNDGPEKAVINFNQVDGELKIEESNNE